MCQMLAQKLTENNIEFEKCMDVSVMEQKGIRHVPVLEQDDGTMISFREALKFLGEIEKGYCASCEVAGNGAEGE